MARLLLRLALFAALFMASGACIKALLPYSWGSPWWTMKARDAASRAPSPSIHYIGSSRVFRHIAPAITDSVLGAHGHAVSSFNWGTPATNPPEQYRLIIAAVQRGEIRPGGTIVLEALEPRPVEPHLQRSARSSYLMNPADWWRLMRFARCCLPGKEREALMASRTRALLNNLFHIGQLEGMRMRWPFTLHDLDGIDRAGFLSLDRQLAEGIKQGEETELPRRRHQLLADTLELERQRRQSEEVRAAPPGPAPEGWAQMAEELESACAVHGLRVIWLLPPKGVTPREWAFFARVPAERRIDMNDPAAHPEFYLLSHRFDTGHLNARGAILHSQRVAQALLGLLNGTPG